MARSVKNSRAFKDIKNLNARTERLFTAKPPSETFEYHQITQKEQYIDAIRESGLTYKYITKNGVQIPVIENTAENRSMRKQLNVAMKAQRLTLQQMKTYYTKENPETQDKLYMKQLEENIEFLYRETGGLPDDVMQELRDSKGHASVELAREIANLVKEEKQRQKEWAEQFVNKPPKEKVNRNKRNIRTK